MEGTTHEVTKVGYLFRTANIISYSYGELGIFLGGGQTENICTPAEK